MTERAASIERPENHGRRMRVGSVVACGVVLSLVAVGFAIAAGAGWSKLVNSYTLTNFVIGLGFLAPGATIAWFRTRHVIGTLFLVCAVGHLLTAAATMLMLFGAGTGWPVLLTRVLSTVSTGAWQVGIAGLFPVALLLFPTGRLPSARWWPLVVVLVLSMAFQLTTGVLADGSVLGRSPELRSILSVGLELPEPVVDVAGTVASLAFLPVLGALVLRYVRGDDRVRRQLLWLLLAVLAALLINSQRLVTGEGPILFLLSFLLVPTAIAIAVVRYELFDIRLVLSRALLYGLAVGGVLALFAGIVAGASLLLPADAERGVSVAAVILVAMVFAPLRSMLRRLIDQAFFGSRSDPAGTARRIGEGLRHDDDLNGALDRARVALRLPWLALRGGTDGRELAAVGTPDGSASAEVALQYRGEAVGTLVIGLRRGERQLHDADRRTFELIAIPLAVALRATALSEQVQRARAATVEAGAAERVRLQRDLHDGLGPALTSVTFRADAASNLIRDDVDEADRILGEIRAELRTAADDLRRLVYGLRPIELQDLGLRGAVRQKVVALQGEGHQGIAVRLDAPAEIPALSPAVELAAYRIADEALTNALRHSTGANCVLTIAMDGDLVVAVHDDGAPPPSWRPGVGLRSICDRAEELGGSATAGPATTGWEVRARLPLHLSNTESGYEDATST